MFHLFLTLCFLSQCFFSSLPPHPSPSGTSRCLSHVLRVQSFKPLCLPLSLVYQSANLLNCPSLTVPIPPSNNFGTWSSYRMLRLAPIMARSWKIMHFSFRFVHLIFYFMCEQIQNMRATNYILKNIKIYKLFGL